MQVYYEDNVIGIYEFLGIRQGVSYLLGVLVLSSSRIVGASKLDLYSNYGCASYDMYSLEFLVLTAVLILVLIALQLHYGNCYDCNYRYATDDSHVICSNYGIPICWQRGSENNTFWSTLGVIRSGAIDLDGPNSGGVNYLGAAIAIAMTGLDQDMMQNLTVRTLKNAQKTWFY